MSLLIRKDLRLFRRDPAQIPAVRPLLWPAGRVHRLCRHASIRPFNLMIAGGQW